MTAENPAFGPISDKDRSIPPLGQDLKTLSVEKTRTGKVYDFLLGEVCRDIERLAETGCLPLGLPQAIFYRSEPILRSLTATEAYHELPNRKRLVELVEKAMGKEAGE